MRTRAVDERLNREQGFYKFDKRNLYEAKIGKHAQFTV